MAEAANEPIMSFDEYRKIARQYQGQPACHAIVGLMGRLNKALDQRNQAVTEVANRVFDHDKMRDRAEKAERERDKALRTLQAIGDFSMLGEIEDVDKDALEKECGLDLSEIIEMGHDNMIAMARAALNKPKEPTP